MTLLTLQTEHYFFQALGETVAQAQRVLNRALVYHAGQHNLTLDWWRGHYDIDRLDIMPGECFRDGQLLYREPK